MIKVSIVAPNNQKEAKEFLYCIEKAECITAYSKEFLLYKELVEDDSFLMEIENFKILVTVPDEQCALLICETFNGTLIS